MIDPLLFEEIVRLRRDLHQFPETGFDVERTASIVANTLRAAGLEVKEKVGKTGVVADLNIAGSFRYLAFRADMDALPMQEESDLPYKSSVDGKAHLCGHDGHTALLLGAAKFLSQNKQRLKQSIRFIFQPSEEQKPGGAPGMIKDGCLDHVDAIYGLHVWPWLPTGTIGICPGPMLAQSDVFDIRILGRGGHAASPHETIDPIVVGSHIITSAQSIISRMTNPLDAAVLSFTRFSAGSAYNVIPSEALLSGTVRTYQPECLKLIRRTLEEMIEHIAEAFGAKATLDYMSGYPPLINHPQACKAVEEAALRFLPGAQVDLDAKKAMFGEDFAYYVQQVPGCFIQLGCRNEDKQCVFPLHHPRFNLDEECLKIGLKLFSEIAFA